MSLSESSDTSIDSDSSSGEDLDSSLKQELMRSISASSGSDFDGLDEPEPAPPEPSPEQKKELEIIVKKNVNNLSNETLKLLHNGEFGEFTVPQDQTRVFHSLTQEIEDELLYIKKYVKGSHHGEEIKEFDDETRNYERLVESVECIPDFLFVVIVIEKNNGIISEYRYIGIEQMHQFDLLNDYSLLNQVLINLTEFHENGLFHGDIGNPENIMVRHKNGLKSIVLIDFGDVYGLEENTTLAITEGQKSGTDRNPDIAPWRLEEGELVDDELKFNIFKSCDYYSAIYCILKLLKLEQILPLAGKNRINCVTSDTSNFFKSFLPNCKIVSTYPDCWVAALGAGVGCYWSLEETIQRLPLFMKCCELFYSNLDDMKDTLLTDDIETGLFLRIDKEIAAFRIQKQFRKKSKKGTTKYKSRKSRKTRKTRRKSRRKTRRKSRRKTRKTRRTRRTRRTKRTKRTKRRTRRIKKEDLFY